MKKMLKNRKGFTLTELCIVIAIAAIVGVMITTTIVLTSTQKEDIEDEAAFIKEVTDIQIRATKWIRKYDNTNYAIMSVTDADGSTYLAAKDRDAKGNIKDTVAGTLKFKGGALVEDDTESTEYRNVTKITFTTENRLMTEAQKLDPDYKSNQEASVAIFDVIGTKGAGDNTKDREQIVLFPLFSSITRTRIVDGKGDFK